MLLPCPCCHYRTLSERGTLEICPVCFWKDDGRDQTDAHGPNLVSLFEAQSNFTEFGASDLIWIGEVRPPLPSER